MELILTKLIWNFRGEEHTDRLKTTTYAKNDPQRVILQETGERYTIGWWIM